MSSNKRRFSLDEDMTTDSVLCWILGRTVFALRATLGLSVNRDWLSTTLGATRLPSYVFELPALPEAFQLHNASDDGTDNR